MTEPETVEHESGVFVSRTFSFDKKFLERAKDSVQQKPLIDYAGY